MNYSALRNALAAMVFGAAALQAADAWAITKTWVGGNGNNAQRSDWTRAANWSPAVVPTNADLVIIPTSPVGNPTPGFFPTLGANTTIDQLQVQAGATLTLNATLTVDGGASPVIDGAGTISGGTVQVTGGISNGILINDSITMGAFTLNAPVGLNMTVTSGRTVTFNGAVNLTSSEMLVGAVAGAAVTLDVNGTLTVAANGTLNLRAPASVLQLSGNLTLTGGWNAGTSTLLLNPTANQTLNISAGAPRVFNNITVQTDTGGQQIDGDLVTPNAGFTVNGNLTLTRGQFQIGNFTVDVFGNIVSGTNTQSQLDFTAAGLLRCRGNVDIATLSQVVSQVTGPFATIQMNGTTPQTFQIRATTASQYFDLDAFQVSNPAGVTVLNNPNADFTVNGQLTIDAGCTLIVQDVYDPESPVIMGADSVLRLENIVSADSTIMGSTFTTGLNSTVVYAGQGINQIVYTQQSNGTQILYHNLMIDNTAGTVATQQNANILSVDGNFTISPTATFTSNAANGGAMIVRKSFIDNGTFNHANSTVTMGGTGSITGTAASLTFFNLLVDGATTDIVTAARNFTTANTFQVNQGTLTTSGNITMTAQLGMNVGNGAGAAGTAVLALVGPSTLAIAPTRTFSVNATDGRFTSVAGGGSNPTLTHSAAGTFTATVNGQLNLFGLNFSFGDANGLQVTAAATPERIRNVRFTDIAAGANAHHLTITSAGLDLDCPGCMFDTVAANQFNVWAVDSNVGNGIPVRLRFEQRTASNAPGSIGGPGSGEAFDGDDDTNDDGLINGAETTATHGGAIIQWVYTANIDMVGVTQGFPSPAFDWNSFAYYSTYVLMQNSTGGFDTIYVLDASGDLRSYSFTLNVAGERIVGPIFWDSEAAGHVVYFGTSTGRVFKLIDNGSSLVAAGSPWNTPFTTAALLEVTSPVMSDRTNVYFAGRTGAATFGIFAVNIASKTMVLTPQISTASVRPTTAPSWVVAANGTNLFWGSLASASASPAGSRLYRIRASAWGSVNAEFNANSATPPMPPDPAANQDCTTDIVAVTNATNSGTNSTIYVYAGETNGYMHAPDALGTFTTPRTGFPFRDKVSAIRGGAVMDWPRNRLFFGNAAGDLYTLGTSTGTWTLGTNYFRFATPGASAIQTTPLYQDGLLYASSTNGNLFVLDVSAQALVRTWNLGITAATNDVGDVSRDANTGRLYVGTSGGRLYAVNPSTDPTVAP